MQMTANLYQTGSRIQSERSNSSHSSQTGPAHFAHHRKNSQPFKHSRLSQVQKAPVRPATKRVKSVQTADGRLVICGKLIGRGSFADVYKGTIDGIACAIKLMRNSLGKTDQMKMDFLEGSFLFALLRRRSGPLCCAFPFTYRSLPAEVVVLVTLDHENIIDVLAYSTHPVPAIVSEFAERGALSDILVWVLKKSKDKEDKEVVLEGVAADATQSKKETQSSFDERSPYHPKNVAYNGVLAIKVLLDVAKGMAYLHSLKPSPLLHRDMKSGNILVTANWIGKVADFGASKFHVTSETMTSVGTVCWMGESLSNEQVRVDVCSRD